MHQQYRHAPPLPRTETSADGLARGLGWFSLALGAAELLAPHAIARALGTPDNAGLIRAFGAREAVAGIGILASREPAPWIWARVAGDALDLGALGLAMPRPNPQRGTAAAALCTVAAVTVLDVACARALSDARDGSYVSPDFGDRSGFPRPAAEMRGAARSDAGA